MFIRFKNYRVSLVEKIGETGFKTSIYEGSKKVASAEREDGHTNVEDIVVTFLNKNTEKELRKMTINKKRVYIDNVEQEWNPSLITYCLMENKHIYEEIKKLLQSNKMVVKFKGQDYFSVVSGLKNNPESLNILKRKKGYEIDITGNELVQFYEGMRKV